MTPSFVEHGDVVIIIRGVNSLPQAMFNFADSGRGRLPFVFKSRQIPRCPDLIESDDDDMCESDRTFIASR